MTTWNAAPMPELGLELVRDVDAERIRSRLPRWDPRLWGDAQFSKNTRPGNRLLKLGLAWGRERVKARKLQQENVTPWSDVAPVSRFTGKEEDVEVGLQYFGKRYLSPYLGRWISADPLAVHMPGEADLNLYAYVHGGVLKSIDPLGLSEPNEIRDPDAIVAEGHATAQLLKAGWNAVVGTAHALLSTFGPSFSYGAQDKLAASAKVEATPQATKIVTIAEIAIVGVRATAVAIENGPKLVQELASGYQASARQVRAGADAFRQKVLRATGEDVGTSAVPRDLEGEAVAARDALVGKLKGEKHPPATVVGASSESVGRATAGASKGGGRGCAEGTCAENLGNPPDIKFTKATRPRTGEEIPVCENCEATWGRDAFPPDAKFKSDSTPKETPKE